MSSLPWPAHGNIFKMAKRRATGDACSAMKCTNARYKEKCKGMSFYHFPTEEKRCRLWVQNTRRQDLIGKPAQQLSTGGYKLCSNHFESSQFNRPAERKGSLVWNAVPTLFDVPNPPPAISSIRKCKDRSIAEKILKKPRTQSGQDHIDGHQMDNGSTSSDASTSTSDLDNNFSGSSYESGSCKRNMPKIRVSGSWKTNSLVSANQKPVGRPRATDKSYICQLCGGEFVHFRNLKMHKAQVHGVKVQLSAINNSWSKVDSPTYISQENATDVSRQDSLTDDRQTFIKGIFDLLTDYEQTVNGETLDTLTDSAEQTIKRETLDAFTDSEQTVKMETYDTLTHSAEQTIKRETQDAFTDSERTVKMETYDTLTDSAQQTIKRETLDAFTDSEQTVKIETLDTLTDSAEQTIKRETLDAFSDSEETVKMETYDTLTHSAQQTIKRETFDAFADSEQTANRETLDTHIDSVQTVNRETFLALTDSTQTVKKRKTLDTPKYIVQSNNTIAKCVIFTNNKWGPSDCTKALNKSNDLSTPEQTHCGEWPYVCNVCGRSFTWKQCLRRHKLTHIGMKPYVCKVCGKAFSQSCNLKAHGQIHTGEKPFVCKFCGKAFSQCCSLQVHERTHTGDKPYVCKVCGVVSLLVVS